MFSIVKVQLLLILICLLMLETSIVQANDAPSISDRIEVVAKDNQVTFNEHCAESLSNRPKRLTAEMSDELSRIGRYLYGQGQRENINSNIHIQQEIPLASLLEIIDYISANIPGLPVKREFRTSPHFSGDVLLDRINLIENQKDLEEQGYTLEYVAGLDHIKASLQLAYLLRQRFSDPTITTDPDRIHIPEFTRFVNSHIDFVERTIRNSGSPDKSLRLSQLEQLRYEARSVQERKELTYRYLLDLTLRLSILASSQEDLIQFSGGYFLLSELQITADMDYDDITRITREALNRFLDRFQFPEIIMIPTIENSGNVGIISNNRIYGTGVGPIGLANKPIYAHNTTMPPLFFLSHDMLHAVFGEFDMSQFVNLLLYKLQFLPEAPRKRVELVLYELTHERGEKLSIMTPTQLQYLVERNINVSVGYYYSNSSFLPFIPGHNHTYLQVSLFLQKARLDFIRLFTETYAEFNSSETVSSP